MPSKLSSLLSKPSLWTGLYHEFNPPFHAGGDDHLGQGQGTVRKAAWAVLYSLLKGWKGILASNMTIRRAVAEIN